MTLLKVKTPVSIIGFIVLGYFLLTTNYKPGFDVRFPLIGIPFILCGIGIAQYIGSEYRKYTFKKNGWKDPSNP